jgi:cell division protein ZapA
MESAGGGGQATRVRICNQYYDLLGNDPERIRSLAAMVDERMAEVARRTPTVDTLKVAILAALSLADELDEARQATRWEPGEVELLESLTRHVKAVLEDLQSGGDGTDQV